MQTRHRIALLTAGLLIGAHLGIAAVGDPIPDASDQMEPVAGEAQDLVADAPAEATEAQAETAPAPEETAHSPAAAVEEPTVPVPTRHTVPQSTTFPPSTDDRPLLQSLADYLDRTEHLRQTGATGEVFPPSTDDRPLLPSLAAYLEQREARLLATLARPQLASDASAAGTAPVAVLRTGSPTPIQ